MIDLQQSNHNIIFFAAVAPTIGIRVIQALQPVLRGQNNQRSLHTKSQMRQLLHKNFIQDHAQKHKILTATVRYCAGPIRPAFAEDKTDTRIFDISFDFSKKKAF